MSCVMPIPALEKAMALRERQVEGMLRSKTPPEMVSLSRRGKGEGRRRRQRGGREDVLIGTHCKRAAMMNARPLAPTKMMIVQTLTRNRRFMNTRNYDKINWILVIQMPGVTNVEE